MVCSWWDGFRCLYFWWFVLWSKWCFVLHEENDGFFTRFMISYTPKYRPPISPWKPFHVENPKNGMDLLCQVVWLLQRNWLVPHPSGYLVAISTLLKLDSNTCSTFGAPFTDVNRWKKKPSASASNHLQLRNAKNPFTVHYRLFIPSMTG